MPIGSDESARVDSRPVSTYVPSRGSARHHLVWGTPARTLASSLGALALLLSLALPTLGHAELVKSDPAAGATLDTPPTKITLTFSEGLDAGKSSFKIVGPDGNAGTGKASKDGSKVMTATGLTLGAGAFTVEWTSVAEDGHVERGKFAFTVNEPTPPPATPTPAPTDAPSTAPSPTATAAPVATPSPAATPAPLPSPSADTTTPAASSGDVILPIAVALALVAVVGVLVLRRNRTA